MTPPARKAIWIAIVAVILITFIATKSTRAYGSGHPSVATGVNYRNDVICENVGKDIDFSEAHVDRFRVTLREGCFSDWIHVPSSWQYWKVTPVGESSDYWIAYWFPNDAAGMGPYRSNAQYTINKNAHELFRLQGRGTYTFYTNQPMPHPAEDRPTESAQTHESTEPQPIITTDARKNYVQEAFCEDQDSADGQLHYENLRIDHFTVKMKEGCWSPYIFVPNTWQGIYAQSVGMEPDWWIADWQERRTPRGPFTRNDGNSSPYWKEWYSHAFRLQGKGTVLLSVQPQH